MSEAVGGGVRPSIKLQTDESVVWSGGANRRDGLAALGGKLYVTDLRLLWTPNRYLSPLGVDTVQIKLSDLEEVGLERAGSSGLMDTLFGGGARDRLRVEDRDGRVEIWVVSGAGEVSQLIRETVPGETPAETFFE